MVVRINSGMTLKEMKEAISHLKTKRVPKSYEKYCGFLTLKEDPVKWQRKIRGEWR